MPSKAMIGHEASAVQALPSKAILERHVASAVQSPSKATLERHVASAVQTSPSKADSETSTSVDAWLKRA